MQRDGVPVLADAHHGLGIEPPPNQDLGGHPQRRVERRRSDPGPSPGNRLYGLDVDRQRHPRLGPPDGNGAAQGRSVVPPREARLELFTRRPRCSVLFHPPTHVERAVSDGVARIDRERGGKVSRKLAVERSTLRLDEV